MRAWSCGLTSAVGTAISLPGTSRVPVSRAKAAAGTATPSARAARCNLKLILTGRLLLIERVSWMNPNLRRSVAIFRVVRYSDQRASDLARRHNKTREFQAIVIARRAHALVQPNFGRKTRRGRSECPVRPRDRRNWFGASNTAVSEKELTIMLSP